MHRTILLPFVLLWTVNAAPAPKSPTISFNIRTAEDLAVACPPDHAAQCRHAQFLQRLRAGRGADRKSKSRWIEDLLPQTGPEAQRDHGGVRQMGEGRCRPQNGRRQREPHPFHVRTVSLQGMKLMFERGPTARLLE